MAATWPHCFSGADGSFGSQMPFADGIIFGSPNNGSGAWNDGAGAPVEITGIGFFDRPHNPNLNRSAFAHWRTMGIPDDLCGECD
jgi:hypothetical protein